MWGIYAKNGTGIALEFDHAEMDNRFNLTELKRFLSKFSRAENKQQVLNCSELFTNNVFHYIKQFLIRGCCAKKLDLNEEENHLLMSNLDEVLQNKKLLELLEIIINSQAADIENLGCNLQRVVYNNKFNIMPNNFKSYLSALLENNMQDVYKQFDLFYLNKHSIWQNEKEYRLLLPNYTGGIINEVETQYGFPERAADFKSAMEALRSRRRGLRTLQFSSEFKLNYFDYSANKDNTGPMPFADTLPYPTRIYLGWNFKIYECDNCRSSETKEYIAIKVFCQQIKKQSGYDIKLYQLKNAVDYEKNRFRIRRIL